MAVAAPAILALAAVSTVTSTVAAYGAARARQNAAEYQGKVADTNAGLAEQQAKQQEQAGTDQEDAYRRHLAQLLGSQRAGLASTGVDVGSGSALDVFGDTAAAGERDVQAMRTTTARQAWATRVGEFGTQAQAGLYKSEASGISPALSGFDTFAGSASGLASKWYTFGKGGVGTGTGGGYG